MGKDLALTRNVGVMAHIDAGKTTVSERMLFLSGKTHKIGETHEGSATMDYLTAERERGITITSAATTFNWKCGAKTYQFNLIDTPGHVDFAVEVERCLRVLDGAVAVFCAVGGVQPQSESVWRQSERYGVPKVAFVNKMDRDGANFFAVLDQMRKRLGVNPCPIQIPIGHEASFTGVVDLVTLKAYEWRMKDENAKYPEMLETSIPADLQETVDEYRNHLLESVALLDDAFMDKYLSDPASITEDELRAMIRKGTLSRTIVPVMCGSAKRDIGVERLMDSVALYLPSPIDKEVVEAMNAENPEEKEIRKVSPDAPFSGLGFKIVQSDFGSLVFVRVYSGALKSGDVVYNMRSRSKVRISRLSQLNAGKQIAIEVCETGDICALQGVKDLKTGDTLCDEKHPLLLAAINFPEPVIKVAVEAQKQSDVATLEKGLMSLAEEDPSFHFYTDEESGQTIIAGMGELHLEVRMGELKEKEKIEVNMGEPQVSYREAITAPVDHRSVFKKQTGGRGKFADIVFQMLPADEGVEGLQFVDEVKGGNIPKEFIPSVQKGFEIAMKNGPLAGYEMTSLKVILKDGSFHPVDSDQLSFELCAKQAYREACVKASPVLMEPMMRLNITSPADYIGDVIGDINKRRGQIRNSTEEMNSHEIECLVPLSNMFGYVTALRTLTQGRAYSVMEFDHYEALPENLAKEVIEKKNSAKNAKK